MNENFDNLKQLILVEEFKRCLGADIKTYLDEKDAGTLFKAATLADDYSLTHKGKFYKPKFVAKGHVKDSAVPKMGTSSVNLPTLASPGLNVGKKPNQSGSGQFKSGGLFCNYCKRKGHLISNCHSLKAKTEQEATLNALTPSQKSVFENPLCSKTKCTVPDCFDKSESVRSEFLPFVSEGFVSLDNESDAVPIRILRDTGATQSLMLQDTLPFSHESATGESVLAQGIEGTFVHVPLHRIYLKSDLITGSVTMVLDLVYQLRVSLFCWVMI